MATQVIKTNRRSYNHNPQGSATAIVTTAGDNPFERGVSLTTRSMMPGMGMGLGAEPAPAPAAPAPKSEWIQALQTGLTNIGLTALSQEIIQTPSTTSMTGQGAQQLPAAGPTPLSTSGMSPVPPANTLGPYPVRPSMVPQQQGGGMMKMLPWIIGGVAVLGVGGMFLMKKKK